MVQNLPSSIRVWHSLLLACFIIFFAIIGYYTFPQADDYTYGSMYLWGMSDYEHNLLIIDDNKVELLASDIWTAAWSHYIHWSGRYIYPYIMYAAAPYVDSSWTYHLIPGICLLLFVGCIYLLLHNIMPGQPKRVIWFWALVISNFIICGMLAINETLYMLACSAHYWLGMLTTMLAALLLLKFLRTDHPKWRQTLLFALLCFIGMGLNEISAGYLFIMLSMALICSYLYKEALNRPLLLVVLLAFLFLCMNYLSPGNFNRMGSHVSMAEAPSLAELSLLALHKTQQLLVRLLTQTALLPTLLLMLLFFPAIKIPQLHYRRFHWLFSLKAGLIALVVLTFGLIFVATLGHKTTPAGRVMAVIQFCVEFSLLALVIYKLQVIRNFLFTRFKFLSRFTFFWCFCVFLIALCLGQNVYQSAANWVKGDFATYRETMLLWQDMARNNKGKDLVVPPLTVYPRPLVYSHDDFADPHYWVNRDFAAYWRLKSMRAAE